MAAVVFRGAAASADDWPTWRHDAGRTAISPERLPEGLHLQWVREYPPLKPAFWQVRQQRLQFDLGYEPIVAGGMMFVGSSHNDRVTAIDAETGAEKWRFYTDGPVRLAPVAWQGRLYVGCDDGVLYCLDAPTGKLLWKRQAAPSPRKVLGNGRLISAWPARGGPVVAEGRVYFAAGVWPFEGIFVYALDARTGAVAWLNDRCGSRYCTHPHGAASFGGPSPQGYLLVHGDELVVPSGRAFPAYFDLATGALRCFEFGHQGHGSIPGSWFVATGADGRVLVDPEINTETHDIGQQVVGQRGVRLVPGEVLPDEVSVGGRAYRLQRGAAAAISAGGRQYGFSDSLPGVEGTIHTMLAAGARLFVVTREGRIYCLGAEKAAPKRYPVETAPLDRPADGWAERAKEIVERTGAAEGYGLVWGLGSGRLAEELVRQTNLHVLVVDPDAAKVGTFRRRMDRAGLYGVHVAAGVGNPAEFGFPPYLARLIVSEDLEAAGLGRGQAFAQSAFAALRPYGGALCLESNDDQHAALARSCEGATLPGAQLKRDGVYSVLVRGALPGAADYTGRPNRDQRVRAPLGLLWFGDTFHHHKLFYKTFQHETGRGLPQTIRVVDGVMKYEATKTPYGPNPPLVPYHQYLRLLERTKAYLDAYTDVYTGRVLSDAEAARVAFPQSGPGAPDDAGQNVNIPAGRTNPLTGIVEARSFLKTYGCDRYAADYGSVLTLRSGTAAFYDKRTESGTINVSGMRSGCRNSIVPACGVLCLPSWTGNCTCNYPCFTSLALAPVPPGFEQWSAWGEVAVEAPVRRVGINFGAPGDRATEEGTLWLDWPSAGGPSPLVPVGVTPKDAAPFYRHSLWIEGGRAWPWVAGSGLRGVRSVTIGPVALRSAPPSPSFSVRWAGLVEPEFAGDYTFHARSDHGVRLWIDGKLLLDNEKELRRGRHGEIAGTLPLAAGRKVRLVMEYYGPKDRKPEQAAVAELQWSSAKVPKAPVAAARLFTPQGRPGGLVAATFDGPDFSGPAALGTEPQVRVACAPGKRPEALKRLERPVRLPERAFTVRLCFAEPDDLGPGQRVFSVKLQGAEVLKDLDVVKEAGGPRRGIVRQFRGVRVKDALQVEFTPSSEKPPVICGVELIEERP